MTSTMNDRSTSARDADLKLALEHHQAGRLDEAERLYDRLHKDDPGDTEVLYLMGVLCCDLGLFDGACRLLERAIDIGGEFPEARQQLATAHNGFARLESENGHVDAARRHFELALTWDPHDAQTLRGLGELALKQADFAAAERQLQRSLDQTGADAGTLNLLGLAQLQQQAYAAAADSLRKALNADPLLNQSRNNLGLALHHQGRLAEARVCFDDALVQDPFYYNARINRANTLRALGQAEEAIRELCAVLEDHPQSADALNNVGAVLQDLGQADSALLRLSEAAALAPDKPEIRWNLALTQLALGDFPAGWGNFEARWEGCPHLRGGYPLPPERAWRGEPLAGKRLLLWAEQGFGDTLQFIRFAADVARLGAHVIAFVPAQLAALVRSAPGVHEVAAQTSAVTPYDYHCPLMSLPHRLAVPLDMDKLHGSTPYLFAPADPRAAWHERLANFPGLKVGLVWAGSSRLQRAELALIDGRRSVRLDDLAPLLTVKDCTFFSVQTGAAGAQRSTAGPIVDFSGEWADFSDTAAFVANLDLVISVDTAVAHLAGALGVQVWLLNRYDSCWRWLRDRGDSPWYASLRQFRQTRRADWKPVVQSMADTLRQQRSAIAAAAAAIAATAAVTGAETAAPSAPATTVAATAATGAATVAATAAPSATAGSVPVSRATTR